MSMQSDLYAALGTYGGLSALIGTRIYPDVADPGAITPRVVWQEIFGNPENGLDGDNGLTHYRVQVTSWAISGTLARAVDAQVRAAMAASTLSNICIDNRSLGFDAETKLHGVQSDFSVWYRT